MRKTIRGKGGHRVLRLSLIAALAGAAALVVAPAAHADNGPQALTVDATALASSTPVSLSQFWIQQSLPTPQLFGPFDTSTVQNVTLDGPGEYQILLGSGMYYDCNLWVSGDDEWSFTPNPGEVCPGAYGQGSPNLHLIGLPVQIDARQLSTTDLTWANLAAPSFTTSSVQTLRLLPLVAGEQYAVEPGAGLVSSCTFAVTANIDDPYDPYAQIVVPSDDTACESATTTTVPKLTYHGFATTLDARALSTTRMQFADLHLPTVWSTSTAHTFRLLPLTPDNGYRMQVGHGLVTDCRFNVSLTGSVVLDAADQPCLGTGATSASTVVFNGFPLTFDATRLSTSKYQINAYGLDHGVGSRVTREYQLMPVVGVGYAIQVGTTVTDFHFDLDPSTGGVTYDLASMANGAGTSTLVVRGARIIVDATPLTSGTDRFTLGNDIWAPSFEENCAISMHLLPDTYGFTSPDHGSFSWQVSTDGTASLISGATADVSVDGAGMVLTVGHFA